MKDLGAKTYLIGFSISVLLTLTAYFIVVYESLSGWVLVAAVISLAFIQLFVQLVFFLHLWGKSRSRWDLVILFSTAAVILIVVVGSLWIMQNLDYRHEFEEKVKEVVEKEGIAE